jgi:hypothetical protein
MTVRNHDPWSDEQLFELFATLPWLEPGAGFADRVLAVLPRRAWLDSPWTRAWLVAALLAVAVSSALLVPTAFAAARIAGPATILGFWIGAVGDLFSGIGRSFGAWERLADLSRALAVALAQPRALLLLAANLGLAVAAFRGLLSLKPGRSASHVSLAS